ncbi:2-oxoglutarate dehydrogenase E1 component [Duganella aceris]|uniref:oxoglutarate dehydrogenase (succinyl-transferring) n=1 Tax=Duganella aceris TaxID=2703883 RepID=A0ABX0FL00_9BURK|nr:2-oxoglutarate dehydrogenase E1 component [Duganella aceris]NGZ85205.1 2-oxoglutarate dehydrogenase E1 component [Duganella aceris]
MMLQTQKTSFLFGDNVPYIEDLYESYLADAGSVSDEWRSYFGALQTAPAVDGSDKADVAHNVVIDKFAAMARRARPCFEGAAMALARKQVAVQSLIAAYRVVGTRQADLDPLRWSPGHPLAELTPAFYGLDETDMNASFSTADTYFSDAETLPLKETVAALRQTYCGTLGAEFMYLADAAQRQWWQMRLESARSRPNLSAEHRRRILQRLTAAEGLEKYLHTRYTGQKRFSLEGGESLIVLLDELIQYGAANGLKSVILGMAHRGRLNVLVNTVGKPARALFDEFEGKTAHLLPAGDVKYHKGYSGKAVTPDGEVDVVLAFNASHLEIVNPMVQGIARAHAELLGEHGQRAVLPVEIHGDVAISGQGIVMETMNLSYTKGHGTGGTVHIVVNNQIGFTTSDPSETRSTFYCTDIAKMIEAPVLHVNADDPEAVVMAVQLALEYRTTFGRSVVIDLVCFRRHGHQEQDTPGITQPLMYRSIAGHPGARSIYAQKLVAERLLTAEQVAEYESAYREHLARQADAEDAPHVAAPAATSRAAYVAPQLEDIRHLAQALTVVPEAYTLHPLVGKVISARREMAAGAKPLDWGMGEHLAFASLLAQGVTVRLSGQDCERGTFSHRHAVLNNQNRAVRHEGKYTPLNHVAPKQGVFTVNNSILSEAAVLGFEYGYSSVREDALVIWEAQFGDFANGAQVVIDNFISAAAAKWGQQNGLTMFLPHGQEGAGPEHASARLERYLQLCAQENIQVCQPTTPAQLFHMLRRQASPLDRKPLVVMTPKSLLRHAEAVSSLEELASGGFKEVLPDAGAAAQDAAIEKVIVCSGKVYFDLVEQRRANKADSVAIVRLEQLYPFPAAALAQELVRYVNLRKVVWCQEEPRNQGAWKVIEEDLRTVLPPAATLHDACREASASTAPGYASLHLEQQARLVDNAFGA